MTSLIDSGSATCLCPPKYIPFANKSWPIRKDDELVGATGHALEGRCMAEFSLSLGNQELGKVDFFCFGASVPLNYAIIGMDFLKQRSSVIETNHQIIKLTAPNGVTKLHTYRNKRENPILRKVPRTFGHPHSRLCPSLQANGLRADGSTINPSVW
jgi:hypothetical protein